MQFKTRASSYMVCSQHLILWVLISLIGITYSWELSVGDNSMYLSTLKIFASLLTPPSWSLWSQHLIEQHNIIYQCVLQSVFLHHNKWLKHFFLQVVMYLDLNTKVRVIKVLSLNFLGRLILIFIRKMLYVCSLADEGWLSV